MQPQSRNDAFQPKWRHFHPQSVVWVQNVLPHDVVFKVADEHDVQYEYKMPAGKISELPGGSVATLGVKAIVDELIQNNKNDVLRIWDKEVRGKYEDEVILRVKDAPSKEDRLGQGGTINLGVGLSVAEEEDEPLPEIAEEAVEVSQVEEIPFPTTEADKRAKDIAKKATAKLPAAAEVKE